MEPVLLKGIDVARRLNISRSQAFQIMKTGMIPTVRFGKLVRVRAEDVDKFITDNLAKDKNEH